MAETCKNELLNTDSICEECGKMFKIAIWRKESNRGRFCSKKCKDIVASKSKKGVKRPPFSDEWKANIGKATLKRINCNKGRLLGPNGRKGMKLGPLSDETREKLRQSHLGPKAYNWKGGRRKVVKAIRETYKYRQWRSKIFERDNWTCQTCNTRGCYLEAHHIYKFSKILDDETILTVEQSMGKSRLWDISNGVTLCKDCHNLTKRK